MNRDLDLFREIENGKVFSILRIYSWWPRCVSLGYSQKLEEINLERAKELGWEVVKRPTGGGIVFHNEAEVSYSLITTIDNPLLPGGLIPSYKKISEAIVLALNQVGISAKIKNSKQSVLNSKPQLCFSYPTEYEVTLKGKKIVGSAQKRGRKGLLQQGSLFVRRTPVEAFSILKRKDGDINAISIEEVLGREIGFEELSQAVMFGFEKTFRITFKLSVLCGFLR